jgi:hypothetical protein
MHGASHLFLHNAMHHDAHKLPLFVCASSLTSFSPFSRPFVFPFTIPSSFHLPIPHHTRSLPSLSVPCTIDMHPLHSFHLCALPLFAIPLSPPSLPFIFLVTMGKRPSQAKGTSEHHKKRRQTKKCHRDTGSENHHRGQNRCECAF